LLLLLFSGNIRAGCFKFSNAPLLCPDLHAYILMELKGPAILWIIFRTIFVIKKMLGVVLFYALDNLMLLSVFSPVESIGNTAQ
jgi:hypothetical protein